MSTQPALNTGIDPQIIAQLNTLAASLTPSQLNWIGGYFTGLSLQGSGQLLESNNSVGSDNLLTILYGSQTGHSRSVAEELHHAAQESGIASELVSMGKFKEKNLKKLKYALVIISTQGEGDPPDEALSLVEYINSNKAPKLKDLQYGVLGLGDSSYEFYCKTSKDFDAKLEELGGTRVVDLIGLDVDFDDGVEEWIPQAIEKMKALIPEGEAQATTQTFNTIGATSSVNYSRKKPLITRLLTCQKITGRNSEKDIRHIEVDLEESGMTYKPGDSLGVWFKNDKKLVTHLLELLQINAETTVQIKNESKCIHDALVETYELTLLHPSFVIEYAKLANSDELLKISAETTSLQAYIENRQIIDVVRQSPAPIDADIFIGLLRKLT
ncbi:MAG: flavodoxin domain-containing protein, partial [Candidatus Margulisbacteria bacterium]|nr:flavodoxin domain-containing protein [Candidatus Margulisiibacteriota bacterium]